MPFKTSASHDNGSVIKTKISIPRNTVIENDAVFQCDDAS